MPVIKDIGNTLILHGRIECTLFFSQFTDSFPASHENCSPCGRDFKIENKVHVPNAHLNIFI